MEGLAPRPTSRVPGERISRSASVCGLVLFQSLASSSKLVVFASRARRGSESSHEASSSVLWTEAALAPWGSCCSSAGPCGTGSGAGGCSASTWAWSSRGGSDRLVRAADFLFFAFPLPTALGACVLAVCSRALGDFDCQNRRTMLTVKCEQLFVFASI